MLCGDLSGNGVGLSTHTGCYGSDCPQFTGGADKGCWQGGHNGRQGIGLREGFTGGIRKEDKVKEER